MGSISFEKGRFADHLHEIIGYKSGIAASIEHMCDLLSGTGFDDKISNSEINGLRIRSDDYESLYYELLHKVGVTDKPYGGIYEVFQIQREMEKSEGMEFATNIQDIYHRNMRLETTRSIQENKKSLDPTGMMEEAYNKYGKLGLDSILKLIYGYAELMNYSPQSAMRFHQWGNVINIEDLFSEYRPVVSDGIFLDQRFIDYLSVNTEKLCGIHWRKFEELTAECFSKFGYSVELGPGSNDDGVDVRVWNDDQRGAPKYIIQCKRMKSKIDKVTIKGLYADVLHEGSELGILVTSSELSVGARKTISARSYPIEEVNNGKIKSWLSELRTPGSGIVRV
ncbi:restriction endonuclease [Moritella marina ATCC 15381]|uniref:Restriction endonuclease n=1 Tax=Moritella marina ATCC 15381 TaxID=1202962 RepID=A0A5J6WP33_MORMI|nr:restriction endonuclease [Moritella marina]QFI39929.1 restriction endonuclease [Moritella marina ATCC 15381]